MNEIALSNNLSQIELTDKEKVIFQYYMFYNDAGMREGLFNWALNESPKRIMITSYTTHERIFHLLFPSLEQQVTFGTGKNGYKEWGVKKFTLDFYDRDRNIAFEIDGKSHWTKIGKLKDKYRDGLLRLLHNIKTVRYTNLEVEDMLKKRIKELGVEHFGISS